MESHLLEGFFMQMSAFFHRSVVHFDIKINKNASTDMIFPDDLLWIRYQNAPSISNERKVSSFRMIP